jgi:hypothetical protein
MSHPNASFPTFTLAFIGETNEPIEADGYHPWTRLWDKGYDQEKTQAFLKGNPEVGTFKVERFAAQGIVLERLSYLGTDLGPCAYVYERGRPWNSIPEERIGELFAEWLAERPVVADSLRKVPAGEEASA